jgi:hypothetical protein
MVICIIALVVFSILGMGSIHYRRMAKEAFECVFRMVTFRPCISEFDQKIRANLTAKLIKRPFLARYFYKSFPILSWIFVLIFLVSLGYSIQSIYFLIKYGTPCEPISDDCPFGDKGMTCGCKNLCQCENETCESVEYKKCDRNCTCQREICNQVI